MSDYPCHTVLCDQCGQALDGHYHTAEAANAVALSVGWTKDGKRHTCPECKPKESGVKAQTTA